MTEVGRGGNGSPETPAANRKFENKLVTNTLKMGLVTLGAGKGMEHSRHFLKKCFHV